MAFAEVSLDRLRDLGWEPRNVIPGADEQPLRWGKAERRRYRRSRMSPLPVVTHLRGTAEFRLLLDNGPLLITPARARELVAGGHARLAVLAAR